MHTGIISFCDRVAYNIKSVEIKQVILNELEKSYGIKILNKHYYKLNDASIPHIMATQHLITLRSNGNPYYMFFTMYEDIEIIYFIDKKVHPTYQQPRIIICRGLFDKSLFKGTLIDGEMVRTDKEKWLFLMHDLISYKGCYQIKINLPERIKSLYHLLETHYQSDDIVDVCSYQVKSYYNLCVSSILNFPKYDYTIRGIYFVAFNLKYKPKLMNYNEDVIQEVIIKTKDTTDFQVLNELHETKENITYNNDIKETPIRTLNLIKTEYPDVYNIIDSTLSGNVCIQSINASHKIRNAFKDKIAGIQIPFQCVLNETFNKWQVIVE